jgi:hypothetical protein
MAITLTDLGDHDRPISAITPRGIRSSACSRSST